MARLSVVGGVHRDSGNAEILRGALNPQRDFAAVGNQKLFHWLDSVRDGCGTARMQARM
jgi:hypothetical protein